MTVQLSNFLAELSRIHAGGKATEHSYRPALQVLFNALAPGEVEAAGDRPRDAGDHHDLGQKRAEGRKMAG